MRRTELEKRLWNTFIAPIVDFRILGWTVLVGVFAYLTDPHGVRLISVCCYVAFFWLFALSIRKIVFPYNKNTEFDEKGVKDPLKLSDFFKEAYHGNIAAAIACCAQVAFMAAVALSFILWLRP